MTTALCRRYRPEAFGEMIGQSQVTDPLMTALRSDRVIIVKDGRVVGDLWKPTAEQMEQAL